jgi:hypothetical protein
MNFAALLQIYVFIVSSCFHKTDFLSTTVFSKMSHQNKTKVSRDCLIVLAAEKYKGHVM